MRPSPVLRRARTARGAVLVLVVAAGILAGCSSSSSTSSSTTAAAHPATTACTSPVPVPVRATPVSGVPTDWSITSFDGTVIRAHWFPLDAYVPSAAPGPHPTVLMGPGWGLPGDTGISGQGILGGLPIKDLFAAGYNVLTWDPRGFGKSGGVAEVDSPNYEAKDVSVLINWVATLPGVQLDHPGDPRMGMVGGSYGGTIQLVTAATDCRVDAIVPTIAWHTLPSSLDTSDTYKSGWSAILTSLSGSERVAPVVADAKATALRTGTITPAQRAWFAARGPAQYLGGIHVPTLIVQGTADTLFTLREGVDNYEALRSRNVTTSMIWFCGGHGVCLTDPGNTGLVEQATLTWLKHYVQRDTTAALGTGFTFVDQNGATYAAPSWPVPLTLPFTATGSGTLSLVSTGGSGPLTVPIPNGQELGSLVAAITPAPATNAVDVPVTIPRAGVIVGAPHLVLAYHGTAGSGTRPERVFAQLVDTSTGLVLGNQVTPVPVVLDGADHTVTLPLEMVAYTATPASHLELQLVATTTAYTTPRLGGSVTFSTIHLALPVSTFTTTG